MNNEKFILLYFLISLTTLLYAANPSSLKTLTGKTITAKTKAGTRSFVFSADGKKVTLDYEYNHTFVKEINGILIYEGQYNKTKHFDAFKVLDSKTVLVAVGSIRNTFQEFSDSEKVAANIEKLGIKYTIK